MLFYVPNFGFWICTIILGSISHNISVSQITPQFVGKLIFESANGLSPHIIIFTSTCTISHSIEGKYFIKIFFLFSTDYDFYI